MVDTADMFASRHRPLSVYTTLTKTAHRAYRCSTCTFHAVREALHVGLLHVFGRDPLTQHAAHAVASDGHRVALGVRTDHSLALDTRHVGRVGTAQPAVNTHELAIYRIQMSAC